MSKLPPPPVPEKLREMLKDYPELIQEIRDTLDGYAKKPNSLQPFDGALWLLEDTLSSFYSKARSELKAAEASGDVQAIQNAKEKRLAIGRASANLWVPDLRVYFEAHKEAFQ